MRDSQIIASAKQKLIKIHQRVAIIFRLLKDDTIIFTQILSQKIQHVDTFPIIFQLVHFQNYSNDC